MSEKWDDFGMADIRDLQKKVVAFRDERNWQQFHSDYKDLALSLSLEAAEVLEHFQWKDEKEFKKYLKTHKEDVADELSDVLYWVLLISHDLGIDISDAFVKKLAKTAKKYPVEKARGSKKKYTEI